MEDCAAADRPETSLDAICRNVLQLLAGAGDTPARLRVEAGGMFVEIEWPAKTATAVIADPVAAASGFASPGSAPSRINHNEAEKRFCIPAPSVGTFYHAPEPGAPPFVQVDEEVDSGRQVGILEVMKLLTPVLADHPGRIIEFLVSDGMPVEHGQSLIVCAAI